MRARAEVRRAVRREQAKHNTTPFDGKPFDYYVEEKPELTDNQKFVRRAGAVAMALVFPVLGALFLLVAATGRGKGEQVAPVLSLMVGVLFGIPLVSILVRNVQAVWEETR